MQRTAPLPVSVSHAACTIWPRIARTQLAALAAQTGPRRAVIVGTAGAGRSRMLDALEHALAAEGGSVARVSPGSSTRGLDTAAAVLVDDLDLLDDDALSAVSALVGDPGASVVATVHAGPVSAEVDRLTHLLERSAPAIVLGRIVAEDVTAGHSDARMSAECVREIVDAAGGIAWLVCTALSLHDGCEGGAGSHGVIHSALVDLVAHRVEMLDPAVRDAVEAASLAGSPPPDADLVARAHAAGLLLRNGRPAPLVRSAVLASLTPDRIAAHWHDLIDTAPVDTEFLGSLEGVRDTELAAELMRQGRLLLPVDPRRAVRMFDSAVAAGADRVDATIARALADWAAGDLAAASARAEGLGDAGAPAADRVADLEAALWSARGLATQAAAVYAATASWHATTRANAAVAALATGDAEPLRSLVADAADGRPTTRGVADGLLTRGLRESLADDPRPAVADLVRASDLATAAGGIHPSPELPAVIAAIAALNIGELGIAHQVLDQARHGGQGGTPVADRLLLWSSWVALQRESGHEAETLLAAAEASPRPLDPRDRLLAEALRVSIARRYSDAAGLAAAWQRAADSLLRARFDLFGLLPLTEFVVASARVQGAGDVDAHLANAFALVSRLGDPVGWSAHLHWAAIQRAILRSSPTELQPHARALVAASGRNRLAAVMAQAGRVWTSVLAGSVDADAVEKASHALASAGLAWDGARLAGHGAARSEDRKVISRLLACARQLHPRDESAAAASGAAHASDAATRTSPVQVLSPRELEVAELVLQGKTYVEIGEAIFISPRTAEHHISRIRRRLDATSRSDLMSKLRQLFEESGGPPGSDP